MSMCRRFLKILSMITILAIICSSFQLSYVSAQGEDGLERQINTQTGKVSFIGPESEPVLSASKALGTFARPQDPAMALAKRFGHEFGLKDSRRDLTEIRANRLEDGRINVRFQQNYQGIPVMGAELIVNTNENGDLYSMNGEVSPDIAISTQPEIGSEQARQTALAAMAKWYQKAPEDFIATEPELWVYDENLLRPSTRPAELVWRMEMTPKEAGMPVRELVLVNAQRGSISLHFNQIDTAWGGSFIDENKTLLEIADMNSDNLLDVITSHGGQRAGVYLQQNDGTLSAEALYPIPSPSNFKQDLSIGDVNSDGLIDILIAGGRGLLILYRNSIPSGGGHRLTYTANQGTNLPGEVRCDETEPFCTNGTDPHADAAHVYAGGIWNIYHDKHGRDSIDNNGITTVSTVHFGSGYNNASWDGEQMVYGDASGWPLADDVVAHEFTHGVTQYESNLFYYYQSGAINESFSDLWGEYYDQTNGLGTDTAALKWKIGEDSQDSGTGAIRDMSNPPVYNDPDRMSSPHYYEGDGDSGGVHTNSGVNNKAVYLMVDGGTFNGRTVSALGWEKTSAIYYMVNTNLLTSGADYSDLYYALRQACTNLIGQKGITAADCNEVKDAIDAVEMNTQPAPNFNTDAPYCNTSNPGTTVFSDDLESGTANWTFSNGTYPRWQWDSPYGQYAQSGDHFLYADDYPGVVTDATARLASFTVPNNAYLRFAQAYDFESGYNFDDPTFYDFDGGVLEYSINNGSTWVDAGSLIDYNGYKGTIFTGAGNPLSGRSAFVGSSHGYVSTRLNLYSLAGKTVSFRWRMGLDEAYYAWGWWVDNVRIFTCPVILGRNTTGVFRPSNGLLYLKNSNTTGFADVAINYGLGGDYPVTGDWDGNGTATIGVYRNGSFYLRNSNTLGFADLVFAFGAPGDQPVAGDWNEDGVDTIGVYRPSTGQFLLRNSNTAGAAEMSFYLGNVGDVGIAGDWNGDGIDTTGVFRPSNGVIFLKNTNSTGVADIALNYGLPGDQPVTGDWDGDGDDTIGVYRNGQFYLRNSNTVGFADLVFALGIPGDMPIAGNWDGLP